MSVNVYSTGPSPFLRIRYMGCCRQPYQVKVPPMLRNSYIIHYVTGGRGFYNGALVEKGQGFLITPGHIEEYHADPNDPWELLWVVSEDPAMQQIFDTFDADPSTGVFSFDYISAVRHAGDTLHLMPRRVVSCSELLELFLSFYKYHDPTASCRSEQTRMATYVDFALQYFHLNYQSPVSISELTSLLGVSQPYFFRIFKSATGKSPKQYLGDYRFLQAKKLLRETSLSIGQVAASVGYPDPLAFSKFFTLRQGVSPQKYRQDMTAAE